MGRTHFPQTSPPPNPDEGFQPTSGSISELSFRNTPNVWGYFSTYKGVHEFSDSQFGHLFAWGANRAIARNNMVCALKELTIRGDIRTTVEYLITLMETNAFRENEISTVLDWRRVDLEEKGIELERVPCDQETDCSS